MDHSMPISVSRLAALTLRDPTAQGGIGDLPIDGEGDGWKCQPFPNK